MFLIEVQKLAMMLPEFCQVNLASLCNGVLHWNDFRCNIIANSIVKNRFIVTLYLDIIYLQSECIEKYQFELYSKYDKEHDSDVIQDKSCVV